MGETEISWTHKPGTVGRTWNPVQGCRRISPGCEHCYAERLAARFAESGWSQGLINIKTRKWNGAARLATHKLSEPLSWRKPSTVFVNSMSDLFYDGFTNEQIAAVFGVMAAAPQHTFQVLTKRAKRMREWFEWVDRSITRHWHGRWGVLFEHLQSLAGEAASDAAWQRAIAHEPTPTNLGDAGCHDWPLPNVWLGVSVENQEAADERIPELLRTPAAVRFLSCEPLLGDLDIRAFLHRGRWLVCPRCLFATNGSNETTCPNDSTTLGHDLVIDWVIAGCESGPGARECKVEWLRSLRDQCAAARVPYFLKQARDTWTDEGEDQSVVPDAGSKRKAGGVIELPYLDGVQHANFPEAQ